MRPAAHWTGDVSMGDRQPGLLTRFALSAVVSATVVALLADPGHADPDRVPDPGVRPAPGVEVRLPDGTVAPAVPRTPEGPLAAQIAQVELEIVAVTAKLSDLQAQAAPATGAVARAEAELAEATAAREEAERQLDSLVDEVFRESTAVPPHLVGPKLNALSVLVPVGVEPPVGAQAAARRLTEAEEGEQAAIEAMATAADAERCRAEEIRARVDD